MAFFRPQIQIPGVILLKETGYQSLLLQSPRLINSALTENVRSFWSRKSKKPVQYGAGNCGEPLPPCMDLVCKDCPSKCIESDNSEQKSKWKLFSFKKRPKVKEKPSNCKKEEKPEEEKLSWWEMIFGPSPKRFWPDPCICRRAHRERKKMRSRDPRLQDPRYQITSGDVLLYTETIKPKRESCMEPQPKPPPGYKVPKGVLYKLISDTSEIALINRMVINNQKCEGNRSTDLAPYRIPFEELRPPERKRKPFNCRLGVPSEDVLPPMNRNLNTSTIPQQQIRQLNLRKDLESLQMYQEELLPEKKSISDEIVQKRSRIEQLKYLITKKDKCQCVQSSK